ncbi:hypothetical protein Hanom_Chr14g01272071 [Helianthus anomalus]
MNYRTQTNTLPNINERPRTLFMLFHLTKQTEFLVHVHSFIKRTNTNSFPPKCRTVC